LERYINWKRSFLLINGIYLLTGYQYSIRAIKKNPDHSILEFLEKNEATIVGKTPSFVDGQFASIAHTQNLKLVTKNTKDFKPFRIELVGF